MRSDKRKKETGEKTNKREKKRRKAKDPIRMAVTNRFM